LVADLTSAPISDRAPPIVRENALKDDRLTPLPDAQALARRQLPGRGVLFPEDRVGGVRAKKIRVDLGPSRLDKSSSSYAAIRGREQQLTDGFREHGISANKINGISPRNRLLEEFFRAAEELG
jgi:hypothetical protein